jgi:hypothetical protein
MTRPCRCSRLEDLRDATPWGESEGGDRLALAVGVGNAFCSALLPDEVSTDDAVVPALSDDWPGERVDVRDG